MKVLVIVVATSTLLVLPESEGYVIPRPLLRNGFRHVQRAMNERMPVGKRAFDRLDSSPFGFALYNSAGLFDEGLPETLEGHWHENGSNLADTDAFEEQWQENSLHAPDSKTHHRQPKRVFFHASDGYLLG
ncbi:hypothetical protein AAVH_24931 [Aphelenchoides avenae]|nr:hypothetical protein AAVH_24931 [Aphelenchus avenae]